MYPLGENGGENRPDDVNCPKEEGKVLHLLHGREKLDISYVPVFFCAKCATKYVMREVAVVTTTRSLFTSSHSHFSTVDSVFFFHRQREKEERERCLYIPGEDVVDAERLVSDLEKKNSSTITIFSSHQTSSDVMKMCKLNESQKK